MDPAVFLGNLKALKLHVTCYSDVCTPMFIVAQFIVAKSWKWSMCPSTHEWIMAVWCSAMEFYSVIKKVKFESCVGK